MIYIALLDDDNQCTLNQLIHLKRKASCTELEDEPGELGSWKVISGAFGIRRVASMRYSRNLPLHCCFHRAGHLVRMMLVSFGEKQETTRERRAVVERKREQGNEGVATAEMRRNIGILLRVEKGKKSYKQQRQRKELE